MVSLSVLAIALLAAVGLLGLMSKNSSQSELRDAREDVVTRIRLYAVNEVAVLNSAILTPLASSMARAVSV